MSAGAAPRVPEAIGVVGAGTMGSGIAQLAAQAGARTLLYDAVPDGLRRGIDRIRSDLEHGVARGRIAPSEAEAIVGRIVAVSSLAELAGCGLVIEAAPERLELKRELFCALAEVVAGDCVLATNTSSLSVTEIAAATPGPERVVGMHFFNPPPVMRLVEVVAGEQTGERALALVRSVGEAMGKVVIAAADVAGFLVNRCARPYSLIALRLLAERVATVQQIDRIARLQGGFPMGPFELQDLVGLDTNHAVAEALQRSSYGEPRYQPSPLQARLVAAGRLGRKSGRGWYDYADGERPGQYRPLDPEPPAVGGGAGRRVRICGQLPIVCELAEAAREAGFEVVAVAGRELAAPGGQTSGDPDGPTGADDGPTGAVERSTGTSWGRADQGSTGVGEPWLTLLCERGLTATGPRARLVWDASLHACDPAAAGFHVVAPLAAARLIEVTCTPVTDPSALERLRELIGAIGRHAEEVQDTPGLVLGRIVACLINEAAFALGEGNGSAEDVDAGLTLGLNHPRGPVAWSSALGLRHVAGILDALAAELGEERYRPAPLLRRRLALGAGGLI